MEALGFGLVFMLIYYLVVFGVSITMYLFESIGLYKMGNNMGLPNPWLSFIPFANVYAFGRIAEKYVKLDGKPSAKFGKILLTLYIIMCALLVALLVVVFVFVLLEAMGSPSLDAFFNSDIVSAPASTLFVIFLLVSVFGILGVAIAFSIVYYIALWRLFALYDHDNATVYFVLSFIFGIMGPIFIFILRNKQAKVFMPQPPQPVSYEQPVEPQQDENIM